MTPAQRGTAMHTFMQFCDYEKAKDDLETEISRLLSCRLYIKRASKRS